MGRAALPCHPRDAAMTHTPPTPLARYDYIGIAARVPAVFMDALGQTGSLAEVRGPLRASGASDGSQYMGLKKQHRPRSTATQRQGLTPSAAF